MELNREQIIKACEHCLNKKTNSLKDCPDCKYFYKGYRCKTGLLADALALIKQQDEQIFKLENRLKEGENGYEGTLYLDRCKLHDAEQKIKELTEKNERLRERIQCKPLFLPSCAESRIYKLKMAVTKIRFEASCKT